jgi:tRNA dimethylallyltransferase
LEISPLEELLRELETRDPVTFQTIDRQNPRRVIRAIEVIRQTGRPFSEQRAKWQKAGATSEFRMIGVARPSGELVERIHRRVDEMFRNGLVGETETLLQRGLEKNQTARQALGYRQVIEHLNGERSLAATIELVKIRTRQFAKRQLTWFRRQMNLEWITLSGDGAGDFAPLFSRSEKDIAARNPNADQNKSG